MKSERDFKFDLGQRVRAKINGFDGIITARTEWLYSCVGYTVNPTELDKDGNPRDSRTFDEDSIELVAETEHVDTMVRSGGPVRSPVPGH